MSNNVSQPTKVRTVVFIMLSCMLLSCSSVLALTDEECLECHSDTELTTEKEGKTVSLFVDAETFASTIHADNGCVSCHIDADVDEDEHPFPLEKVNCGECHEEINEVYTNSVHGKATSNNDEFAPSCSDCHSNHSILPKTSKKSSTYPLNIPFMCGRCHREGSSMVASRSDDLSTHNIIENYSMSIHGKGLFKDGLIVTAVCSSCHTAHNVRKASDPQSSISRDNVTDTCNICHVGIVDKFVNSVHSPTVTKTDKKLPVCIDCHNSHTIDRVEQKNFRLIIASQCRNCHEHETETYFETYHGRASMLWGGERTAKCSDCHGSHGIMPAHSPESMINTARIVETCKPCHPGSNLSFTTYLPHATHSKKDKDKYPYLYYTFWAMTGLLTSTFAFFGIHTIFWIPRAIIERIKAMVKEH